MTALVNQSSRQQCQPVFLALHQTAWNDLSKAVREHVAQRWHEEAGFWSPRNIRLVVSLHLLPTAKLDVADLPHLDSLLLWLAAQCEHLEVTSSYKQEHRLYLE